MTQRIALIVVAPVLIVLFMLRLPALTAAVPQVHVDPRVIRLPVVDGRNIRFTRISTADGLSQTRVAQIVQDDRGFMWFGTQYGLNRYDGYKFKVFVHDSRHSNSLGGVYISSLFKDRSGALWIGCDQSLDRFDPTTETFTHYSADSENPEGLSGTVVHISQDRTGMLWLATGSGLHRMDPRTGQIVHYRHNPNDPAGLSSSDVKWTGEDRSGTFWVGTSEGLDAFDRETGKVTLRVPLHEEVQISFYEDRFGVFWITYASGTGLAVFDRKTNRVTRYSLYKRDPESTALTGVMGILEDREGTLWLGSPGAGLLQFDREGRRFIRYRNKPGDPDSLAEDKVIALFEDREGNIWTGLHSMGPNHFAARQPVFETLRHEAGNPKSLRMNFVNAIYEDRQGILWIGNDDGLDRIDRKKGEYSHWNSGLGVKPMVIMIGEDLPGNLWVGTYGHGLNRYDRRTGRFKTYRHNPADASSLSNDAVYKLFIDHTGTLWVATDDGLNRFDPATDNFRVYKVDGQSRLSQSYISVAEDRQGALWLGTHYSGLHRFDPATGQFTVYKFNPNVPGSLQDNLVPSVYLDHSGNIWVGTQIGLEKFNPPTHTFTAYDEGDRPPGNTVSCILEDQRGDLWMSTNKGLSRFNPLRNTFTHYSVADGLPGNDLTGWNACFKSPSGEMFFGGFPGAIAFHPDSVVDASYVPPIVLTDFRLSGTPVEVGTGSLLQRSITYTDWLTLAPKQNVFSLGFSALSFLSPSTNRYRYKLDELDREWNEVASDQRVVNYTTLPAGTYTFRVQGAIDRGAWSEPGAVLRIQVLPPWWATWWFRAACAALTLILLWCAHYFRIHQIAQQFNMRLEERVRERTRIARELHDTLLQSLHGLMFRFQAARNMLPRRPDEAIQALDGALTRTEEAIAESRDAIQDLRSGPLAGNDLTHLVNALGQELVGSKETSSDSPTFRVTVEGTPQSLHPAFQDEIYAIAREALRNAFRHAHARAIEAEIRFSDHLIRIRIRDDGKGINPAVLKEGGLAGHWGLPGLRERAKALSAHLDFWSEVGAGTEVELTVPASAVYAASHGRAGFWSFGKKKANS